MPTPINITFTVGALEPGASYNTQEYAEAIAAILAGTVSPDVFVPGIASATAPDQDKGLFLDLSTDPPTIKFWDSASSTYVRDQSQTPIGSMLFWPGTGAIPSNYLICDGAAKNKSTYSILYAALGGESSPYGSDATNFNLPNMSRRAPYGSGAATGKTTWNVGDQVGSETASLEVNNLPDHPHNIRGFGITDANRSGRVIIDDDRNSDDQVGYDPGAISGGGNGTDTGDPFSIVSPGLVGKWIIRAL